mmetsp:Transcript_14030/g.32501  ORF Transcript_14030/g.32501 Transcript_14030/m.32501 type:complete len:115 (+) Transcript_14030:114-458(+)|eukprot:CAMPEP_0116844896 /NCGR_PEP_ID=MMETSP0418-20121206/12956_1 /TAXON_ID=1158023 /ORGANISM="Astrosyne radiata, Strain 13vi08-1A" /LENGTH=114 /DNA_ID=CAMNT_0004475927 /DNA_START=104 /DNA_END=448 /DNA_ORIENTATION=-
MVLYKGRLAEAAALEMQCFVRRIWANEEATKRRHVRDAATKLQSHARVVLAKKDLRAKRIAHEKWVAKVKELEQQQRETAAPETQQQQGPEQQKTVIRLSWNLTGTSNHTNFMF